MAAELGAVPDCRDSGRADVNVPEADIFRDATSSLVGFRGGGKGDIEIFVTDAEWAWYTRRDWKAGSCMTCCGMISRGLEDDRADERAYNVSVVSPYYHLVTGDQK